MSKEFVVEVMMHHGAVLSLFLVAVIVDYDAEFARDGTLVSYCMLMT